MLSVKTKAASVLRGAADWITRSGTAPAFDAGGNGRRTRDWQATSEHINAILFASAANLRSRSRDMARKNPWALGGIDNYVANAIGTGIQPLPSHPDENIRKELKEAWLDWTDEADADGVTDLYGLQATAVRGMKVGGEVFGRFRPRRLDDGFFVPLQVQLLEAEHVPTDLTRPLGNGGYIRQGIEFNPIGQRVAYHVYREHPGEQSLTARGHEIVRVPASEMFHVFYPTRPGQIRGTPGLSTVLLRLFEFDHYEDGELVRKRDTAQFSGFIKETGAPAPDGGPLKGTAETDSAGASIEVTRLEAGTYQKLKANEDIINAPAADMGEGYSDFMRWVLRAIAKGMGITYEQLTGDLTGVNYSSIRAGLLEFRRELEQFQHTVFIFQFCRPVWNRWLETAVLAGSLSISPATYLRDRRLLRRVVWMPQGWDWVDPLKEINAKVKEIRAGLTSRSKAVAKRGDDIEQLDEEIAADNKRADDLDLVFDSDARVVSNAGLTQARPPDSEIPDGDEAEKGEDEDEESEDRRRA